MQSDGKPKKEASDEKAASSLPLGASMKARATCVKQQMCPVEKWHAAMGENRTGLISRGDTAMD